MNSLEKEFITYNLALEMKQLGFKEMVLTYFEWGEIKLYNSIQGWDFNSSLMNVVSRPTFSQCFRWFRKKCNIQGYIYPRTIQGYKNGRIFTNYVYTIKPLYGDITESEVFDTYEQAEQECLKQLIKIVKDEK